MFYQKYTISFPDRLLSESNMMQTGGSSNNILSWGRKWRRHQNTVMIAKEITGKSLYFERYLMTSFTTIYYHLT